MPPGYRLTGIIKTPSGRFANVNGAFVTVGHIINGARVVKISDFAIEMELNGRRFPLGITSAPPPPPPDIRMADDEEYDSDEDADDGEE